MRLRIFLICVCLAAAAPACSGNTHAKHEPDSSTELRCGGPTNTTCPEHLACDRDDRVAGSVGTCRKPNCGGIAGFACPKNQRCVGIPINISDGMGVCRPED